MKNLTRHLWLAVALLMVVHPAWADADFDMEVDCPPSASSDSTITIAVSLVSRECSPLDVRFMSSIAGNADHTVGGIGIWGPVLAKTITVDAATDLLPGTCDLVQGKCDRTSGATCSADADCLSGICDYEQCLGGVNLRCDTDADCVCQHVTPGGTTDSVEALPKIPVELVGTIATFVLIGEGDSGGPGGTRTLVQSCMVDVIP